jgi:PEP-CTERM motif
MLSFDRFFNASARRLSPLAFAVCALAAAPAHAVDFTESGDAGQTVATGQTTTGAAGALVNIFGSLGATNDADLFLINITNPGSFSAMTVSLGGDDLDTQLFLFTLSGAPVFTNDDAASGTTLLSALPAGNAFGPVSAGLYYIGVALSGYNPVNIANQFLFADGLPTDVRGPASGLQPATLSGFDGDGFGPSGNYNIRFTGAAVASVTTIPAVPEPSSVLLMLAGGALVAAQYARRSRKSAVGAQA